MLAELALIVVPEEKSINERCIPVVSPPTGEQRDSVYLNRLSNFSGTILSGLFCLEYIVLG